MCTSPHRLATQTQTSAQTKKSERLNCYFLLFLNSNLPFLYLLFFSNSRKMRGREKRRSLELHFVPVPATPPSSSSHELGLPPLFCYTVKNPFLHTPSISP